MDIPVFKSEGQRQAYWRKQRMLELQLDEANDSKISKAYHDVDFGVIPAIKDNRSIKEIEQDTNLQRTLARKNAMTLMADDGYAADRLLALIGKQNHVIFNRFAPDIIEKLRNQIGRIDPVQAQRYINVHVTTQTNPAKMIPPTGDQLTNLMNVMNQRFGENNKAIQDVLLKLEAYRAVLASGTPPKGLPEGLPTGDDIDDAVDEVANEEKDDKQALRDLMDKMAIEYITRKTLQELYDQIMEETMNEGVQYAAEEMVDWEAPIETPADEETKGGDDEPTGEPKGGDDEGDDDEEDIPPKPKPKPVPDDDDDDDDEEEEMYLRFEGDIDELRESYRWVGNYYQDLLNQEEGVDYNARTVDRPAADHMRELLKTIRIIPQSALTSANIRELYKANEAKIKSFLDNYDPTRVYTKKANDNKPNVVLLEELKDRLANFQYIKFDPDRPNPGKTKGYPRQDAVLFSNAQLYQTLYDEVTEDVRVKASNVTTSRGGLKSANRVGSASDLYFKYKALQEMATGDTRRTDKNLTYSELKRILEQPIYRETYEKIASDNLTAFNFYLPPRPTGSGFRRKSRRGRR